MKRKTGIREPNGRLQRPTVTKLKELEAARYRENMLQAAAQPHRRGLRDPLDRRAENAFGRFCIAHRVRSELYDAGQEWADIVRRWNVAKGVPDPVHTGGMGSGQGPSPETVGKWWATIRRIRAALEAEGWMVANTTRWLVIDNNPAGPSELAIRGLQIVARELGRWSENQHPFERAA